MIIHDIQVINFRNLVAVRAEFKAGLNLLYGRNAQGKTNLLEAVYMLVTGRSFRTTSERELIPWAKDAYEATVVRARVEKRTGEERCLLTFNQNEKHVFVNGESIHKLGDLIGRINAVLFTPEDLQLVRGSPGLRRRFMDIELSQVSRLYLQHLQRYDLALRQRNAILRQHQHRPGLARELAVYDEALIAHGTEMICYRQQMLAELSDLAEECYRQISEGSEPLRLQYRPSPSKKADVQNGTAQDLYRAALAASIAEDIRRGTTSVGPHRDDFDFVLGGHSARDYGSQGQQRSCVLALKLAELEYMKRVTGEAPLLLLDDLMSELDAPRRKALLAGLSPGIQTFLTTTEKEPVLELVSPQRIFQVEDGQVALEPS